MATRVQSGLLAAYYLGSRPQHPSFAESAFVDIWTSCLLLQSERRRYLLHPRTIPYQRRLLFHYFSKLKTVRSGQQSVCHQQKPVEDRGHLLSVLSVKYAFNLV